LKNVSRKLTATLIAIGLVGVIAAGASTAIAKPTSSSASIKACALLPDTTSSTRYTLFDAPYLKAAFKKAGIAATVVNAHNDPQKQKSQAQQCLAQGAKVILLDQLDATSGAAITNLAVSQHAKVIDYDRLVVGSKASYYVSFQNPVVGKLQAKGMIAALKARHQYANHPVIAELNGDIKDNNAKLFFRATTRSSTRSTRAACSSWLSLAISGRSGARPLLARNSTRCSLRTATRSTPSSQPTTASQVPSSHR